MPGGENGPAFENANIFRARRELLAVTSEDIVSSFGFIALVIIGIAIILLVVRLVWMLIPAAVIAAIVISGIKKVKSHGPGITPQVPFTQPQCPAPQSRGPLHSRVQAVAVQFSLYAVLMQPVG